MFKDIIKGAIATLVVLVIGFTVGYLVGGNQSDTEFGGGTRMVRGISTDSTSPSAGEVRTTTLTVTGTTTLARSPDGFIVWDNFTLTSTGTAKAVYTNQAGELLCARQGVAYFNSNTTVADKAPAMVVSIGTSTSATGYATGLVSSSTVASSTDTFVSFDDRPFVIGQGVSVVAAWNDGSADTSSTTGYANWTGEFAVHCWSTGQ